VRFEVYLAICLSYQFQLFLFGLFAGRILEKDYLLNCFNLQ
jgi:hypothetical protein